VTRIEKIDTGKAIIEVVRGDVESPMDWLTFRLAGREYQIHLTAPLRDTDDPDIAIIDQAQPFRLRRAVAEMLLAQARDERDERNAYRQARRAKVAEIPGLAALRAAVAERNRYRDAMREMMEDEDNDGVNPPRQPTADFSQLIASFPRAWAYLRAEEMAAAANYSKSAEGRRALAEIVNGAGPEALAAAEARWADTARNMVD